jgi:3-oxoacyl-(acyl-carrier-protein) synthase
MAEGAAVVMVEELEHALRRGARIYCEVIGYGASNDAYHVATPHPESVGVIEMMRAALGSAGISPHDVDYINAHGTSTPYNDAAETLAIRTVFGDHADQMAVSSIKSMIGHLFGAAGAIEALATALTIHHGVIPPTINYRTPDPECDLDYVPNVAREANVKVALSNSMGLGGHNGCVILKKFDG